MSFEKPNGLNRAFQQKNSDFLMKIEFFRESRVKSLNVIGQ
jgi:hypothetical protein